MSNIAFSDYSLVSFIYNSSFVNQHFITDSINKLSFLDITLLHNINQNSSVLVFFNAFISDLCLSFDITNISVLPLFSSVYQDTFNLILLFSPELVMSFSDYFYVYYFNSSIFYNVSSCFDSYTSNLNFNFNENLISLFMFFFFV